MATLKLSKKLTLLPLIAASTAGATSVSATLVVTVIVPPVCQVKTVTLNEHKSAFDFRCNIIGSGAVSVENTAYGAFSLTEDCRNKNPSMLVPLRLEAQRLYLCNLVAGESPTVFFTVP